MARELTKIHETFTLGRLDALGDLDVSLLGEFTVVVGPPAPGARAVDEDGLRAILREELAAGGKPREVARRAAARAPGWSTGQAYALLGDLDR